MNKIALKNLCYLTMGQSPSSNTYNLEKRGYPFYQGNADFGKLHPHARIWCDQPKKMARKNDILVSVRAPIGELNIANEDCCIGRGLAAITINKSKSNLMYVFYALTAYNKVLKEKGTGSTFKAINKSALEEILLPEYDKRKQEEIGQILHYVDDLIDKIKQEINLYDVLVKSRFVEMFGDPVDNDKSWSQKKLFEITTKIGSGATPKGGEKNYSSVGISFIRSMNVHDGRFEYKNLVHISEVQAKQLQNVEVMENDVFINITGASVSRTCVVPASVLPARVNQHVAIIRACKSVVNPVFLNNVFLSSSCKRKLLNIGESSGATRQAITKHQLELFDIILPPIELQNQFADFVQQVDKSKLAVQKSLDELEILKKSLMQQYFG